MVCGDWLFTTMQGGTLSDADSAAFSGTSGDIDPVVIFILLVSRCLPKHQNRYFKNDLFVVLDKTSGNMSTI